MQVRSIDLNYNNYKCYQNSRANFQGKFHNGDTGKFARYVETNMNRRGFPGRQSVITKPEKLEKAKALANRVATNIRFIQTNQSPLVECGFEPLALGYYGNPITIYDTKNICERAIQDDETDIFFGWKLGTLYEKIESKIDLCDEDFTNDTKRIERELYFIKLAQNTIKMLKDPNAYIIEEGADSNTVPYSREEGIVNGYWADIDITGVKNSNDFHALLSKFDYYDIENPRLEHLKEFIDKYVTPLIKYASKPDEKRQCDIAIYIYNKLLEASSWFCKNPEFSNADITKKLNSVIKLYKKSGLVEKYYDYESRKVSIDFSVFQNSEYENLFV